MGNHLAIKYRAKLRLATCIIVFWFGARHQALADPSGNGNFFVTLADPQLSLATAAITNGQIQIALNGEPGVSYVIESSPDMSNWTPVLTNNDSAAARIITLPSTNATSFYRARRSPLPLFQYALAARDNITMNGSSQATDSFNSGGPNASTGGLYDAAKARTNGTVASVDGIVYPGSDTIGGNLLLGPLASFASPTNQVLGAIEVDQTINLPDMIVTNGLWLAAPTVSGTNLISASGYYFINNALPIEVPAGINAALYVTAPNFNLNIQIHGGTTNSGTAYIFLAGTTNATLLGNRASDASHQAKNLCIFGLPSLTFFSVDILHTGEFAGVIYAPSAIANLTAGAAAHNFYGSCIAKSVSLNGNFFIHYDEDLLNSGPFR